MHDVTNVGLVDAHTEGNGCNHNRTLVVQPLVLHVVADLVAETGVVAHRRYPSLPETRTYWVILHVLCIYILHVSYSITVRVYL